MPENEIVCIFFQNETGILTSNQFRREIESPFTDLNDKSAKLAGKTYTYSMMPLIMKWGVPLIGDLILCHFWVNLSKSIDCCKK